MENGDRSIKKMVKSSRDSVDINEISIKSTFNLSINVLLGIY